MRRNENIDNIKNLLNQGDLEQAIRSLVFMDDLRNSVRDDLKDINSEFDELKWEKISNLLTSEELIAKENEIRKDLVNVLNSIENWTEDEDDEEEYTPPEDWQAELEDEHFEKRERVKVKGDVESINEVNIWKLGTIWGRGRPSFYNFIK